MCDIKNWKEFNESVGSYDDMESERRIENTEPDILTLLNDEFNTFIYNRHEPDGRQSSKISISELSLYINEFKMEDFFINSINDFELDENIMENFIEFIKSKNYQDLTMGYVYRDFEHFIYNLTNNIS